MKPVATVWVPLPAQRLDGESKANPDAASNVTWHFQTKGREVRKRWGEIIKELEEFLTLEDDWDGAGAEKPNPETIRYCIAFANRLADQPYMPAPSVSPTVEGGAVFQWQSDAGRLEIEVNEPHRGECMLSIRGQKPKHWVIS